MDRVLIASASSKKTFQETALYESTRNLIDDYDLMFFPENKESLPVVYNRMLEVAKKDDYDALIFVHDDVQIEHNPIPKLSKLFTSYDIVGVAGCSEAKIEHPALWHLMGGGWTGGKLHGAVAHGNEQQKHMTSFGPYPHRVLMIDGVFMALNRNAIEKASFDESNPAGFHFYDLDFSFNAHKIGLKVGVGDIYINHQSPGLRSFTEEWLAGEKWFLEKYGN